MAEVGPILVGSKTVASAGTAEALTDRTILCSAVVIKAKVGNSNPVFVVDTATESKKFPMTAGDSITIPVNNPALISIDVTTNAEGVDWIAV